MSTNHRITYDEFGSETIDKLTCVWPLPKENIFSRPIALNSSLLETISDEDIANVADAISFKNAIGVFFDPNKGI